MAAGHWSIETPAMYERMLATLISLFNIVLTAFLFPSPFDYLLVYLLIERMTFWLGMVL